MSWAKLTFFCACGGGFCWWALRLPELPPPPRVETPSEPLRLADSVMNAWLPACGGTIGQMSGSFPEVTEQEGGAYRLRWVSANFQPGSEMLMEYNPGTSLAKPLNQATRNLLDIRYACKRL